MTTEKVEPPDAEWIKLLPCHSCKTDDKLDVDYENDQVICEQCGLTISPIDKWNDARVNRDAHYEAMKEALIDCEEWIRGHYQPRLIRPEIMGRTAGEMSAAVRDVLSKIEGEQQQ